MDIKILRESLDYDPDTGVLTWKRRPASHFANARVCKAWHTRYEGKTTGWRDSLGYLLINIGGRPQLAHRLGWAILHGEFVPFLDHINGNPSDNRIANLRACTKSQNQHNRGVNKNNTSGFKGVCWHSGVGRWRAYIVINWKQKHLGLFDTPEQAHAAYRAAADLMHGEFANHGHFDGASI